MACSISDIAVTAIDDGAGNAASLTVSGLADECASGRVVVKLFCDGTPVGAEVAVIVDGAWSVVFDDPPCTCGGEARVEAECEGDLGCRTIFVAPLECTLPEGECPAIDDVEVTVGGCVDGLRTVTFTITTNAPDDSVGELAFGDGDTDAFLIESGIDTNEITHAYAPGEYFPSLTFILPEGCPPFVLDPIDLGVCCLDRDAVDVAISDCKADGTRDVTFTFPGLVNGTLDFGDGESVGFNGVSQTRAYRPRDEPYTVTLTQEGCEPLDFTIAIDECPIVCLAANDIEVVVGEQCSPDRQRTVTFVFARDVLAEIDFGDGSPPEDIAGDQISHDYAARVSPTTAYTAVVAQGGDCDPVSLDVVIPACPCVTAEQVGTVPAEDCDEDGRRAVTFAFPWEVTADIDYGDGESEQFTSATRTHTYVPRDEAYHASLAVEGCPPVALDVTVPACNGAGAGGGGGEDNDCGDLTYVVAVLLGLGLATALLLLTLTCLAVPFPWLLWLIPAVLAAAAVVVIILWYAFCDPPTRCDWLRIAWMVALVGAIVALYLSGCCGALMIGISIGLFAVAALAFAGWLVECHPTACQVLADLAVALATAAGGILSAIGLAAAIFPPLFACVLWWVAAGLGLLVAALVPLALNCED